MPDNLSTILGNGKPHKDYDQFRRFACDRCRGQKLRCLRESSNRGSCMRCQRAKAECISSPPLRMGRRCRTAVTNHERLKSLQPEKDAIPDNNEAPLTPSGAEDESLLTMLDGGLSRHREDSILYSEKVMSDSNSWTARNLSSGHSSTHSFPSWDNWCRPTPSSSFNGFNFGDFMFNDSVSPLGSDSCREEPFRSGLSDPVSLATSSLTASCTPGSEVGVRNHVRRIQGHDTFRFTGLLANDIPESQPAGLVAAGSSRIYQGTFPANMARIGPGEESYMQQLSDLTQQLYIQLKILEVDSWSRCLSSLSLTTGISCSKTSVETDATKPIRDILSSSEKFLELMGRFAPSTQPSGSLNRISSASENHGSPDASSNNDRIGSGSETWVSSCTHSAISDSGSCKPLPVSSSHSTDSAGSDQEVSTVLYPIDTPILLLLLTCYIRFLRIYGTLFSHIHRYLLSLSSLPEPTSSHKPPSTNILSSLQIGGFSLQSYDNLQIMILIEISVHLVTRIEEALGIPCKYKLSDVKGDEGENRGRGSRGGGVLEEAGMANLLEIVMGIVDRDRGGGRGGGVKALREDVKRVKQLLKI